LAVCGFPRIDRLLDSLPAREETLTKLGISADAPVVLYTPNKFAQAFTSDILDSIQRTDSSSHTHWVIKLHPAVKTKDTWEAAIRQRQLDRVQVVDGASDFYALLAACDVHATFASTTLIEAAVLGRPNVGISTSSITDPAGYSDAGAYLPVPPGQLGPLVMKLLEDQEWQASLLRKQRAFADDWCLHDGNAVERIVALLERVVTKWPEKRS
jgi:CDP-glycerol glycerophosphotransferase (TagB/SpsB family)